MSDVQIPHGGQVVVSLSEKDGNAGISVQDNGPTISEEYRGGLFSRISQVEAKKNPGCRYGRGLGLYAMGLAVEMLNGSVEIAEVDGLCDFIFVSPSRQSGIRAGPGGLLSLL